MGDHLAVSAFVIFTGSGPILALFTYPSITDDRLLHKLHDKGIDDFIAYRVELETVERRYRHAYGNVCRDLEGIEDIRVLDFNGHQVLAAFRLDELGDPVRYARPAAAAAVEAVEVDSDVDFVPVSTAEMPAPVIGPVGPIRNEWRQILCTTDFSEDAARAVLYGVSMAQEFSAKLFVAHVVDFSVAAMHGEMTYGEVHELPEQRRAVQRRLARDVGGMSSDADLDWVPLVGTGPVAEVVGAQAAENEVDLVITATHGRAGLRRLMMGSVTERLLETLPCPVLVVRTPERDFVDGPGQRMMVKRILVGVDFSPDADLAVQYGLSLAQEFESHLHLVHVIHPPVYRDMLRSGTHREELGQDMLDELREQLDGMVSEEARNWCTARSALLAGKPYDELTKYALVHDIDLIVLGIRGHGLVESFLIGSTTDRVIRNAPCPVLAVRPSHRHLPAAEAARKARGAKESS